jgi:hypothetical protein
LSGRYPVPVPLTDSKLALERADASGPGEEPDVTEAPDIAATPR